MPRRPDRLPPAQDRRLRGALRGRPVHPDVGADPCLVHEALDVRLGYLLGRPDTAASDVGASLLTTVAPGPDTRRRLERTLSGFLSEHRARASALAPGRVLGATAERALAGDAMLLALLSRAARATDPARLPLLAPAVAGLDDERLHALVDPRVVGDVVRLTVAAEHGLWRPLASSRVERTGERGRWRMGDADVLVVVPGGRAGLRAVRAAAQAPDGTPGWAWFARHEALVRLHDGEVDQDEPHGEHDPVSRPRTR